MADTANNTERVINVNEILHQLTNEGKTRNEIKEHYGLNHAEAKLLFGHPKLKGVKTKKSPRIIIVDEPIETEPENVTPINEPSVSNKHFFGQEIN